MLSDTKDLISDVLKKNNSVYENLKKTKSIKEFLEINKQNENLTIKGFETDKNIKRFNSQKILKKKKMKIIKLLIKELMLLIVI